MLSSLKIKTVLRPTNSLLIAICAVLYSANVLAFGLDDVTKKAQVLATKRFNVPESNLPSRLRDMKFSDYQKIEYKQQDAWWSRLRSPFRLTFYHQGVYFDTPVDIYELVAGVPRQIRYQPENFDFKDVKYDANELKKLGFSGFNIAYQFARKKDYSAFASFQGASYYRIIGQDQVYGLSARGLAIDTALASGEEFPRFKAFWIERPKPRATQLKLYALLDSPRATGAYCFTITPGEQSIVDVEATLFLRDNALKLGVAPLSSMFLFNPSQPPTLLNFRPSLHDSNGLSIHNGNGEWIWRPLNNPKRLAISTYVITNPRGFGLLQRGRDFTQYQDLKNRYDLRPSAWIEPLDDWGKGKIELVEIPTTDETNDNIVAFWTPDNLPKPLEPFHMRYRLHITSAEKMPGFTEKGWVKTTLRSLGKLSQASQSRQPDGSLSFVIDYIGLAEMGLKENDSIEAQVSTDNNASITHQQVMYNPVTRGWRLLLTMRVKNAKQPTEMRAALASNGQTLTETWSYQLPANE